MKAIGMLFFFLRFFKKPPSIKDHSHSIFGILAKNNMNYEAINDMSVFYSYDRHYVINYYYYIYYHVDFQTLEMTTMKNEYYVKT